jgi:hypothetical protein
MLFCAHIDIKETHGYATRTSEEPDNDARKRPHPPLESGARRADPRQRAANIIGYRR